MTGHRGVYAIDDADRIPCRKGRFSMMSLATLALGLAFFGLFYALVVGCDHL
jgi:hypothetical protein